MQQILGPLGKVMQSSKMRLTGALKLDKNWMNLSYLQGFSARWAFLCCLDGLRQAALAVYMPAFSKYHIKTTSAPH